MEEGRARESGLSWLGGSGRRSTGVTGAAAVCQEDPSESGWWDSSWCRRHKFWRREERDLRMTHLSGETKGSDNDLGSPEDLLPDS